MAVGASNQSNGHRRTAVPSALVFSRKSRCRLAASRPPLILGSASSGKKREGGRRSSFLFRLFGFRSSKDVEETNRMTFFARLLEPATRVGLHPRNTSSARTTLCTVLGSLNTVRLCLDSIWVSSRCGICFSAFSLFLFLLLLCYTRVRLE